jgi:hypothetical protein
MFHKMYYDNNKQQYKSPLKVCNLQISLLKLAKTLWKNPVKTGGGSNRLVGFRNAADLQG